MTEEALAEAHVELAREERTLAGLVRYFAKLGSWGFGGPIALAGYMHRDLVEGRRWYTEDEYQQGLAISQAMPGPLAAQLAMWLGYLERGWRGALSVALPFVVPPFLIVTAIAVLYAHYQGLTLVQDIFFGVAPAVLAIIAIASYKLARATNKRDPVLWAIAAVQAVATVITGQEIVWPFLAAALQASAFTFGSGLAIVPFLHAGLVEEHGWLTEQQFVDAVAMGLITPGPVVIMATFAGYLVYGIVGAIVATAAVFLPVYLFVVVPGKWFRRHERHPRLQGFVKGATAAAAGAIAGAAIVIARQTIGSWLSIAIGLAALALLLQKRLPTPEPAVVALAALAGILLHD